MQKFIDRILTTLEASGFPSKKVSLPTEKMYEAADNKGLSFNAVLDEMKQTHGIIGEIGADKTVFTKIKTEVEQENSFEGLGKGDIFAKAQEMMSKMGPEEMQKMKDMIASMSPEQQAEMMKKGKKMGLV